MTELILGLLGSLAPTAMRIIGMYLDKSNADSVTKQKFLDFVQAAASQPNSSAALSASAEAQLKRLKEAKDAASKDQKPS